MSGEADNGIRLQTIASEITARRVQWQEQALKFILLLTFMSAHSAMAQNHNVGRYVKVADNGTHATYVLVWSAYVPGADAEPLYPGDFIVPFGLGGGGWCDPVTGNCYQPHGAGDIWLSEEPAEMPPITVVGSRPSDVLTAWFVSLQGGGGGSGPGDGVVYRPHPLPDQSCSGLAVGTGLAADGPISQAPFDLLEGEVQDAGMCCDTGNPEYDLNESVWADLWEETLFEESKRIRQSDRYAAKEQGAFLYPGGEVKVVGVDIGVVDESTPCLLSFSLPQGTTFPEGTIFIHSHPWKRMDDQSQACGAPGGLIYRNPVGLEDRPALQELGIEKGVIIDADGVHFYNVDDDDVDNHPKCH